MLNKKLLSASLLLSLGVLAGRLAGLVRESVLATQLGLGPLADAAALIVTIPDLFANLLAGGAISAVLIPELVRREPPEARRLFGQVAAGTVVGFAGLVVVLHLGAGTLVRLLAPGFSGDEVDRAATGVGIALWAIVPTVLAGVVTAFLNARQHFALPAFGTLIYNATIVAALVLGGATASPLALLGWAIVAAALLRLASQAAALPAGTLALPRGPNLVEREFVAHYCLALAAGACPILLPALVRALASLEGLGGLAAINYATKLVELPLGICITVLSAVLLPAMAAALADPARRSEADRLLQAGVSGVLALSYAALLPLFWCSAEFTDFIFGRGRMDGNDIDKIATLASIGFWSLPAQGLSSLLTAGFNARRDTLAPLWINGAGLVATGTLALLAVRFGDLRDLMGAVVAGSGLITVAQLLTLRIRHGVDLCSVLLHAGNLRGLAAAVAVFAPLAAVKTWLQFDGLVAVVWAGVTGLAMLAASVFVTPGLRQLSVRPRTSS